MKFEQPKGSLNNVANRWALSVVLFLFVCEWCVSVGSMQDFIVLFAQLFVIFFVGVSAISKDLPAGFGFANIKRPLHKYE